MKYIFLIFVITLFFAYLSSIPADQPTIVDFAAANETDSESLNSEFVNSNKEKHFRPVPSGSGTEGDPYQIANLSDLQWISDNDTEWGAYFIQTADIDASDTQTWNGGAGFSPIGNTTTLFAGSYDGQGYEIDSLFIDRPATSWIGLFGYTNGSEISNLGLTDVDITGDTHTGGLVGEQYNVSSIENCYVTGSVNGSNQVGGLVGVNYSSCTISNSYNSSSVIGSNYVGGLVGENSTSSTISECYNAGSVSGSSYVGGLVALNSSSSTISNCYSTGSVTESRSAGGLVGWNNGGNINNSFWDTETSGKDTSDGGTGKTTNEMQDVATFTDTTNVGLDIPWDFVGDPYNDTGTDDYWMIFTGNYPMLTWQESLPVVTTNPATSITQTSAVSGGDVIDEGVSQVTVRGVCWSTSPHPTTADDHTTNGSGPGSYTSDIEGLNPFRIYYYRAYATNTLGTGYGEEYTFTTLPLGSGTELVPYQISTLEDLRTLSQDDSFWDACFEQTADIDASDTQTWDRSAGFSPIGNIDTSFTGKYDGLGFEIDSLFIDRSSTDRIGLFGRTEGSEISNLGLTNVDITGDAWTGGLVGVNTSSTITNCYCTGSVSGVHEVGGLVGYNNNSLITNSYSSSGVSGTQNWIGGLVGKNLDSNITNCFSDGSVLGSGYDVGGLVGQNSNFSNISNCYSTSSVDGLYRVGGLVGENLSSIINNCYSTGVVEGSFDFGGLVGDNSATVTNSFWDIETSEQENSAGGTGKTTAEMQDVATYTITSPPDLVIPWDFVGDPNHDTGTDDDWKIFPADYPMLEWQTSRPIVTTTVATSITSSEAESGGNVLSEGSPVTARGVCWSTSPHPTTADDHTTNGSGPGSFISDIVGLTPVTTYYYRAYASNSVGTAYGEEYSFLTLPEGSGTEGDPYQISNLTALRWLSENPSYWGDHFIQTADIDASDTQTWDRSAGFSPIGNTTTLFIGSYDGQGFVIDSLFINRASTDWIGLFGYTEGSEISNLGLTNVDITGDTHTGGLVGEQYNFSTIENCYISGSVNGSNQVGGLAGVSYSSCSISNSYNSSSVDGTNFVGGLVGENSTSSPISNCYNTGSVSGSDTVGGLVALNSISSIINNCYSTGVVGGSFDFGGLVGDNSATVTNSFWDIETSEQENSAGGTGKTTAEMQDVVTYTLILPPELITPWDFVGDPYDDTGTDDIWNIDYSRTNDGYPFLSWQTAAPPAAPTNVVITIAGDDVLLTWDDMGVSSYNIYRSNDPYTLDWGTPYDNSTVNSYNDTGAAAEGMCFYYIKAVD